MTILRRVSIFFMLGLILLIAFWYIFTTQYNKPAPKTINATLIATAKPLSDFTLIDHSGGTFNRQSLQGHWTLLFFGYPRCPDICPQTLGLVRDAWNLGFNNLPKPPIQFVFANIAPEPVETGVLGAFVSNYHSDFIAITGSPDAMHVLSDQLGIYYRNQNTKIDHTSALMLIDPQARLRAIITPPFNAQDLVNDLKLITRT